MRCSPLADIKLPLIKLRLDKWLWAARFFKTRSLAKAAIEGGKVHFNGQRVKVSKEVQVGDELRVRQGYDERTIVILVLSDKRRGAPEAQLLYQETEQSITAREASAQQRKHMNSLSPDKKPNKKDRRKLQHIKQFLE